MSAGRPHRALPAAAALLALALLPGCATPGATEDYDPWEWMNRKTFWFNQQVDDYVLEPTASGWETITSVGVRQSVDRFFLNLRFPVNFVNNLLQARFTGVASETGRFVVNTTVGLLGFFDPATDWGLEAYPEDFGQTLAHWGIPSGPYLVLPLFGPSNPRDTTGLVADYFTYSEVYSEGLDVRSEYLWGARIVDVINTRALLLEPLKQAKEASLDYYTFVRNAYLQRRRIAIEGEQAEPKVNGNDLYDETLYDDELHDDAILPDAPPDAPDTAPDDTTDDPDAPQP